MNHRSPCTCGRSNIDLCWAFYCCIESLVIGHCKHNFYTFMYSKPSLFKPFPRIQLATKAQYFPRKSPNTASPMIARHGRDFTWNRGCSSNSPAQRIEIKFPTPWKTLIIKFPPPRDGKGVKCPGFARGGMLKLRFDRYIIFYDPGFLEKLKSCRFVII